MSVLLNNESINKIKGKHEWLKNKDRHLFDEEISGKEYGEKFDEQKFIYYGHAGIKCKKCGYKLCIFCYLTNQINVPDCDEKYKNIGKKSGQK